MRSIFSFAREVIDLGLQLEMIDQAEGYEGRQAGQSCIQDMELTVSY
jgi:hypothetical protein